MATIFTFMDIPTCAETAGISIKSFRRIIAEQGLRVIQIGKKDFMLTRDFRAWQARRAEQSEPTVQS